jgi:hypothetical protein
MEDSGRLLPFLSNENSSNVVIVFLRQQTAPRYFSQPLLSLSQFLEEFTPDYFFFSHFTIYP